MLTVNAETWADLEFPLSGHNLGIGARDENTSIQAGLVMSLHDISAEDLACTYATVVWTLWAWETIDRPAIRSVRHIKQSVFLLETEPGFVGLVCFHEFGTLVAVVELVGRSIRIPAFGQDQNVWCTTKRIGEDSNRSEIDIGVVARSLPGRGTIEVPLWKVIHVVLLAVLGQLGQGLRHATISKL